MSKITINDEFLDGKDIQINQQEYKTGLKINGKDEYIRLYEFNTLPNNNFIWKDSGLVLTNITLIELGGVIYGNTGNAFSLDTGNQNSGFNNIQFDKSSNRIGIHTYTANYAKALVVIKYIYK